MLDTPPKILFCDLRLDPGESKTCKKLKINQTLIQSRLTFDLNDPLHFLLISACVVYIGYALTTSVIRSEHLNQFRIPHDPDNVDMLLKTGSWLKTNSQLAKVQLFSHVIAHYAWLMSFCTTGDSHM